MIRKSGDLPAVRHGSKTPGREDSVRVKKLGFHQALFCCPLILHHRAFFVPFLMQISRGFPGIKKENI